MVKTTLGPKGMDKILQKVSEGDQSVSVTNDGATILRSVMLDNAAAKVLVDIARVQDEEVGDGTTSVAVFCGELLREAEKLVNERIHPQTIAAGWRIARNIARKALEDSAVDNSHDEALFRSDLEKIATTTLSSKLLTHEKSYFANLAVDAVMRLKGSNNLDHIQILKKAGGQLKDSYLEDGFLMDKQIGVGQPKRVENAKILIANTSMDTDKIKIYGSRVKVDSMNKVAEIEEAEKNKMRQKCEKIIAHGANVFINRQLIYNLPESIFAENGIMAIEHADFDGVERLAAVTGGEVVSTFDHPELVTLGECDVVEEIMIGEDKVIRLGGCKSGAACTIVLRGASSHLLDEAERSLHDALCILQATIKEPRRICGGGCSEVLMALVSLYETVSLTTDSTFSRLVPFLLTPQFFKRQLTVRLKTHLVRRLSQWQHLLPHSVKCLPSLQTTEDTILPSLLPSCVQSMLLVEIPGGWTCIRGKLQT